MQITAKVPAQKVKGRVKVQVVENGVVVADYPEQSNLILDQGLNYFGAGVDWVDLMTYACAGSDGTATSDDSGAVDASQSGTTVTAASAFFASGDAGKLLRFDSGEEAKIVTFSDDQHVEVSVSRAVSSGPFTLYRVNQVGLLSERTLTDCASPVRSNTYLPGAGNCGETHVTGSATHEYKRTYDFSAQINPVIYREVGFSNDGAAGNNLFSRVKLAGDVTVSAGQQLRVIYTLTITLAPVTPAAGAPTITGWSSTDGDSVCVQNGFRSLNTNGTSALRSINATSRNPFAFESDSNTYIWLSTSSDALENYEGSHPDRASGFTIASKALASSSYSAGTFTRSRTATFSTSEANSSVWRTYGLGVGGPTGQLPSSGAIWEFLFDDEQEKLDTHTLTLSIQYTWDRDLS